MQKRNLQLYYNRIIGELILEEVMELHNMLSKYIYQQILDQTKRRVKENVEEKTS